MLRLRENVSDNSVPNSLNNYSRLLWYSGVIRQIHKETMIKQLQKRVAQKGVASAKIGLFAALLCLVRITNSSR